MSYRMKITLPDPTMTQLEALAEQRGEPASRIAAQMICAELADGGTLVGTIPRSRRHRRRRTRTRTGAPLGSSPFSATGNGGPTCGARSSPSTAATRTSWPT
jgi:hypothetical protein